MPHEPAGRYGLALAGAEGPSPKFPRPSKTADPGLTSGAARYGFCSRQLVQAVKIESGILSAGFGPSAVWQLSDQTGCKRCLNRRPLGV
jgi:hypothetical protein